MYVEEPLGDPKKKEAAAACGILFRYKSGVNFVFPFFCCQKTSDSQNSHCNSAFSFSAQVREIKLSRKEN